MRTFLVPLFTLAAAPVLAADLGTYRPGVPYHSVQASGADVCASQCAGDAQCRGWNYVKANPKVQGVCEFQSRVGEPVASAISISGLSRVQAPHSKRVVAGSTNTVRVGTDVARTAKPEARSVQGTRTIVRKPVPQTHQTHQAAHRRVVAPVAGQSQTHVQGHPVPAQPRFRPMLDGSTPARPAMQGAQPQMMRPNPLMSRGPVRTAPQQPAMRPQPARPPVGQPIQPPQTAQMPRSSASQPIAFPQANPSSLYGSLHDDVRVPASNIPMPVDPNAPIPTAASRPIAPVQQSQLAGPAR